MIYNVKLRNYAKLQIVIGNVEFMDLNNKLLQNVEKLETSIMQLKKE